MESDQLCIAGISQGSGRGYIDHQDTFLTLEDVAEFVNFVTIDISGTDVLQPTLIVSFHLFSSLLLEARGYTLE